MSEAAVQASLPRSAEAEPAPKPAMAGPDWALLAAAALAVCAYLFGHAFFSGNLPGLGLAVSHWSVLLVLLAAARRRGRLRIRGNAGGILLLALSLLLGVWYAVYTDLVLRAMNLPVLALITGQAVYALTGQEERGLLSVRGFWAGFSRLFPGMFRHWAAPFRAVSAGAPEKKRVLRDLLLGMCAAVPVLTVALVLLTSADEVFGSFLRGGLDTMMNADGSAVLKVLMVLPMTLGLFSWMFGALTRMPGTPETAARGTDFPALAAAVTLGLLDAVYVAFAVVQVRYLFLGTESVRMAGGYAAYARSGFFQLAALACLTLLLIWPVLSAYRAHRAVRGLCVLTALLTVVIDAAAFVRMRMYISAYGLSLLRVLTLWAMGMILLSLLAVLIKAFRPSAAVSPVIAAVVLTSWVALNYANIDRIVAADQVARYNAGKTEWKTVSRLITETSPDAIPAYALLEDGEAAEKAQAQIAEIYGIAGEKVALYDWGLNWRQAETYRGK